MYTVKNRVNSRKKIDLDFENCNDFAIILRFCQILLVLIGIDLAYFFKTKKCESPTTREMFRKDVSLNHFFLSKPILMYMVLH